MKEGRRPKAEARKKPGGQSLMAARPDDHFAIRRPFSNIATRERKERKGEMTGAFLRFLAWKCRSLAIGLRISDLFRPLDFGFPILYLLALLFSPKVIFGATNLVSGEEIPPLLPPRPEIPPSFGEQYGLWLIAGGTLALAGVCAAVWFLTRPKPPAVIAPAVRARAALESLRDKAEDGVILSEVSQILRRYITAVFGLPEAELTTTEFCEEIGKIENVGPELSAEIRCLLTECDRRKFAPSSFAPPTLPPGAVTRACRLIDQAEARCAQLRQAEAQATPQ
jgi:hypothetical protein